MEQRTHENPQPLDTALNESSVTFALQHEWKGDEAQGGDRHIDRYWVTHEMGSAFVTPPARSPTEMLYSMVLSTGPSSFQIAAWATGGDSIGAKFVGDSEGGFWISLDEESVARTIETAGGVGCGGRTRDVYFGCVPTEAAKPVEVVLVYPRLEVTNAWDVRASGR